MKSINNWFSKLSKFGITLPLAVVVSMLGLLFFSQSALAGIGISVAPNFSSPMTVGQTNVPVSMDITNGSGGATTSIALDNIFLTPSCGDLNVPCTTPDPGVFSASASGTGSDACAADTFTIAVVDAGTGKLQFTPSSPITLTLGAKCTISFTVDVLKVPAHDLIAGGTIQTAQGGQVTAHDPNNNNLPGSGTGTNAITINKASPTIDTSISPAGPVAIGASVHDSSTLTGATANAGGTVVYHAYAGANTCTGTDLLNSSKTVTNGVVPNSNDISFASAGTYSFQAVYSGDANNNGATSTCSTEQLVVNPNAPTISTTLVPAGPVAIGATVNDSSTLTGATSNAGGSVTYHAYAGANTCTGTDLLNSTVTVTNGVVPNSGNFVPASAGTYSFQATYSGDANNTGPVSSTCTTEQLVVNPNAPSISTTLVPTGPVAIGANVHDSAALTGATANAGGTVTYHAYAGSNTCSGTDMFGVSGNAKTVTNGVVPNSDNISFASAGTYSFQATYSGDANNTGPVSSTCTSEQLVVSPNTPSISTTLSASTVNINTNVHDSATLSGTTANAGGTVTYHAYAGANTCSGTDLLNSQVTVTNGAVPNSANISFASPGTYSFQATYSGDANNTGPVSSVCSTEQLVVNSFNASMTTAIHLGTTDSGTPTVITSAPAGSTVHDSATVTGDGPTPTGNVTFTFYSGSGSSVCDAQSVSAGTVALNGSGVADPSSAEGPLTPGSYAFRAHYAGDTNYPNGATSECEPLTITSVQPSISTTPTAGGDVGVTLNDSATLSGGSNPTGSITFNLYNPSNTTCSGAGVYTQTVTVNGNGTYTTTPGFVTNTAGTWRWTAVYSGDSNNLTVSSGCNDEQVTITQPVLQYCSPGYWKQPQHFDSWMSYNPSDSFFTVFGVHITIMYSDKGKPQPLTDPILLQALSANGGGSSMWARVAVDALLNSTSMNSGFTDSQVKQIVHDGFTSGNFSAFSSFTIPENCPLN